MLIDAGEKVGPPDPYYGSYGLNPPMLQLMYYRLGPEPLYTKTHLISEGISHDLSVLVHLVSEPHQPWQAGAWIDLVCEVDPYLCRDHKIASWSSEPASTPLAAAQHIHTAARWVHDFIMANPITSLRQADPSRGHPPLPRNQRD